MMLLALFRTEDFGDYHCAGHAESGAGTDHNKQSFLVVSESGETWSQYKGTVRKIPFLIWDNNISGSEQKTLALLLVEDSCVSSCASSHRVKKGSDNQAKDFQREL